jgi:hypothetical protein
MAALKKPATVKGYLLIAFKPTVPRGRRPAEKSMGNEWRRVVRAPQRGFGEQLKTVKPEMGIVTSADVCSEMRGSAF